MAVALKIIKTMMMMMMMIIIIIIIIIIIMIMLIIYKALSPTYPSQAVVHPKIIVDKHFG